MRNVEEFTDTPDIGTFCTKNPVKTHSRAINYVAADYQDPGAPLASDYIQWVGLEDDSPDSSGCGGWTHTNAIQHSQAAEPVSRTNSQIKQTNTTN